jgi:hypothetical protein
VKEARTWILGGSLLLIAALAFFLVRDLIVNGITLMGLVTIPVVVILAVGIVGALATPPNR